MFFVRTATPGDAVAIGALLALTWRATYTPFYGADKVEAIIADWHSLAAITKRMAMPNGEYVVADNGTLLGGMAFASITAKTVSLHQLYIRPEFQRQGIGALLFAEIESCFMDANSLVLEVEPKHKNAIAFYEAHGCMRGETIANCGASNSGIPALKMTKSLKN